LPGDPGAVRSDERTVVFDRRDPSDPEDQARFEARLEALRSSLVARRIETELVAEIRAAREAPAPENKDLTISIEANDAPN
jgi:hypothetical protein